ncbi:TatD family hydrolase [Sediminibacterium ginsengisoli]|uniref:TatD DNase family protein n=1 Tax=Sediminibacterium ginsengisoli TaxID=413434 RepID=A0A1T4N8C6_9BACT|nr:TatD family hydrolase [Sediminibacterium ginsengisoli]SJZ75307.1 TatD DNase family protein [Sediminibacterium ginsengisoli]
MNLIDTHCHLYADEFKEDLDAVITRAQEQGVKRFYLPAIDSTATEAMLGLEQAYPGVCIAMMGLHPCYVKENYKEELAHVKSWLDKRPFVAVGEIGLDFYWDKTFAGAQREAFDQQMQWALDLKIPIVIHTRNAMQETIEAVKPFAAKGLGGIFHCFSGSYESARQIVDMGFYLGIGGVLTYKNAGLPAALENIPLEHMVLETDAPYLSPVPFRGKRNESSYLQYVAEKLADVKKLSVADVAAITTANAEKIFGN